MSKAHMCLLLHAHLPFVRHPEHENHLEERWLFEAITETYIPLLETFKKLEEDGIPYGFTLSISPTLISMLADELLQEKFVTYLENMICLSEAEISRVSNDVELLKLANMYHTQYSENLILFRDVYKKDLLKQIKNLAKTGKVELITTSATHAYLPSYESFPLAVKAQITTAISTFLDAFGFLPRGFWLPDCGYYPGLDAMLRECGIRYFLTSAHGILLSPITPQYGVFSSYKTEHGCSVFGRDIASTNDVWCSESGYPGNPNYREFYRDIGFDAPIEHVKDYLPDGESRIFTGIKYHAVTGQTDQKNVYNEEKANEQVLIDAKEFIKNRVEQFEYLSKNMDEVPVIVTPFDAELFGHWWFEGPKWIDQVFREGANQDVFEFSNTAKYLKQKEYQQVIEPIFSSWGNQGFSEVWINGSNDWIYKYVFRAIYRMQDLVKRFPNESGLKKVVLDQAAKEILLMQASDWPFILYTGTDTSYAEYRVREHYNNFITIYNNLCKGEIGTSWIIGLVKKNNLFNEIDYRMFKK